jgi:hypothetical protein
MISDEAAVRVQDFLANNYGMLWSVGRGRQLLQPYRESLDDDTWERAIKAYCSTNQYPPDAAKMTQLIDGILRRREEKKRLIETDKHYAAAENSGAWREAVALAHDIVTMLVKKGLNRRNRDDEKLIMKVLSHRNTNLDDAEAVYEKITKAKP